MEPKSSKMKSWKHLVSKMAPKRPPDPLQDRFWRGFGTHLGSFSSVFLTYFQRFLHAFFSSMLQTKTFKITRKHQKNAADIFQETVSLFVPSCIEKFTSERKVAFRSLLVQVETGQMSAAETRQMSAVETRLCPVPILYIRPQQQTSVLSQQQTSALSQQKAEDTRPVSTTHCLSETGQGPDTWNRDGSRQPNSNF